MKRHGDGRVAAATVRAAAGLALAVMSLSASRCAFNVGVPSAGRRPSPSAVAAAAVAPEGAAYGQAAPSAPFARVAGLCGGAAVLLALAGRWSSSARRGITVRAFEEEIGVQPPLGFWDPLGLSADGDVGDFRRRRETELKHGRVAMYAAIGYIVPEYYRWPGFVSPSENLTFEDLPNGLAALGKLPVEGWLQIVAWCGFYETVVYQPQHPAEPGNYYKGRWGVFDKRYIPDKELRREKLNVEMANGRLAMVAITGMMFQNGVVGSTGPEMWIPSA